MSKEYSRSIGEVCRTYNQICGANKNLYRTIPSMIDGLKPGARRLMYILYKSFPRKERNKVAEIAGRVLSIHPHGDSAVVETLVSLGQPFSNNACLIDGKGNYGSQMSMGDDHAAGRYIEARMSEYAWKCFFEDFEDSVVDFKMSFNGKTEEPVVLPAKYPHALFNGVLGIGYGLSSNIPPYNVAEVLNATIALIKNPKQEIVLIPDSPTGCYVLDKGEFEKISKTGVGSYTMRAVTKIDDINNTITITNVPYAVGSNEIKDAIIAMRDDKSNAWLKEQLMDIKDRSNDKNGIMLILKLRPDANPQEFLERLYKKDSKLEKSYPVNIKLIDDYTDYDYSITSFLKAWIAYRRENKQASYSAKLSKLLEQQHINDILLHILKGDNAERTLQLAKNSRTNKEFAERLIDMYSEIRISHMQANAIAEMHIREFTKEAYEGFKAKRLELIEQIAHIENVLKDVSLIDADIIKELEDGIKRFGVPRKSKVLDMVGKKHIPKSNHVLAIGKNGICKKLPDGVSYTGNVGGTVPGVQQMFISVNNRDSILLFDADGKVARVPVSVIPDCGIDDPGVPLSRYFTGMGELVDVIVEDAGMSAPDDYQIFFVTKNGYAKFTKLDKFDKVKNAATAIKLNDGDELVYTTLVKADKHKKDSMMIFTDKGNGIRISVSDIPEYGVATKGLKQVTLENDEVVAGASYVPAKAKLFLYVTNNGKLKLTEARYLPIMDRKSAPVNFLPLEGNEKLRLIKVVDEYDTDLVVYKKSSDPVWVPIKDIPILPRIAKAKKMVSVAKGDYVAGVSILEN